MLNEETQKRIALLPQRIIDMIGSVDLVDIVIRLRAKFDFTQNQIVELNKVILAVFLRDMKIEEMSVLLEENMKITHDQAQEICFTLFSELMYKAKDFFPGIDDEILKLGGEIPKNSFVTLGEQFAKRESEIERMMDEEKKKKEEEVIASTAYGYIDQLMQKFPDIAQQTIGSQQSIEVQDMQVSMKPMIKYWIEDYIKKTGNMKRSNMERVQYVCHDKNTRNMNTEERRQLMLVLKSVDREIELPYSSRMKKIDFSLVE